MLLTAGDTRAAYSTAWLRLQRHPIPSTASHAQCHTSWNSAHGLHPAILPGFPQPLAQLSKLPGITPGMLKFQGPQRDYARQAITSHSPAG
ncbi:hypothetical protein EKO04_004365 [Ascochyta lentis]|uniref:Uncharacterized protein n=1 Tax=Ascochyta lentis TaxID=205686 RepID=A0A8H7J459_9PLEO|nr:hypothetical protein EKO04_004365 [Ascochyta lentis]